MLSYSVSIPAFSDVSKIFRTAGVRGLLLVIRTRNDLVPRFHAAPPASTDASWNVGVAAAASGVPPPLLTCCSGVSLIGPSSSSSSLPDPSPSDELSVWYEPSSSEEFSVLYLMAMWWTWHRHVSNYIDPGKKKATLCSFLQCGIVKLGSNQCRWQQQQQQQQQCLYTQHTRSTHAEQHSRSIV